MTELIEKPRRKRRWVRFSLRSFLIFFTFIGAGIAPYAYRAEKQRAAVQWVQTNGGSVTYRFETDHDGHSQNHHPSGPKWQHKLFGVDYFECVVEVALMDSQVSDLTPLANLTNLKRLALQVSRTSDLTPLAGLTNLDYLWLENDQIGDVVPLAGLSNLSNLDELVIVADKVNDLKPLAGLTNLESLQLWNLQVSDEEIAKLRVALPNCKIEAGLLGDP